MKGKVIRFNPKKGFGFIKSENEKDAFFHYSELQMEGFKTIEVNDEVEFDLVETEKGFAAKNIRKL